MDGYYTIINRASEYSVGERILEGRRHLVVPVIMIREGVHCGSGGCYFYGKEELTQSIRNWNGVPVALGHPFDEDGNPISCQSPGVYENQVFGKVFNPRMSGDRLKADLYIDEGRLLELDSNLHKSIKKGEVVEVSTGLFPTEEGDGGVWNGKEYQARVLGMEPDHLAILPNTTGACSCADGCGIRNQKKEEDENNEMKEKKEILSLEKVIERSSKHDISLVNEDMSLTDLVRKIQVYLDSKDNDAKIYVLQEVFDDYVIYKTIPGSMAQAGSAEMLYRADYSVDNESKEINFDEPVEVREKKEYVPIKNEDCNCNNQIDNKGGEENMEKKEIVQSLIDNEQTPWEEKDKDRLMEMNECSLKSLIPNEDSSEPAEEPVTPEPKGSTEDPIEAAPAANQQISPEEAFNALPDEMKAVLNEGVELRNQKKEQLVNHIMSADHNSFTKDQLNGMEIKVLEGMAKLIPMKEVPGGNISSPVHYGAAMGVLNQAGSDKEEEPLDCPSVNEAMRKSE